MEKKEKKNTHNGRKRQSFKSVFIWYITSYSPFKEKKKGVKTIYETQTMFYIWQRMQNTFFYRGS